MGPGSTSLRRRPSSPFTPPPHCPSPLLLPSPAGPDWSQGHGLPPPAACSGRPAPWRHLGGSGSGTEHSHCSYLELVRPWVFHELYAPHSQFGVQPPATPAPRWRHLHMRTDRSPAAGATRVTTCLLTLGAPILTSPGFSCPVHLVPSLLTASS